jgi:tRNA modification GTPase
MAPCVAPISASDSSIGCVSERKLTPWKRFGSVGPVKAFFRILTAEGRAAIAVIRVWGPGALAAVNSVFRPHRGRSLGGTDPGRLRLGRAGVGLGDEVVAVRLDGPTPTIEIQCHGGAAAVAAVIRSLEAAGAVLAGRDPAALSRVEDRIRAQAMEDLTAAPTLRAAEILLDQAHGALSRSLERLIGEARGGSPLGQSSPSLAELDAVIRAAEVGTRLVSGWKVVIAGRPNVGKSRLFNALTGFDRSIVNPQAGVTRDVVSIRTAFGGWPVELCDTAGERDSGDVVERLGIVRARQERRDADLVLLVLDRSAPLDEIDRNLLEAAATSLVVANKCDLAAAWAAGDLGRNDSRVYLVSAETSEGLGELVGAVESRLVPDPPASGAAIPFRPEHFHGLEQARECLAAMDLDGFVRRLEEIRTFTATP